MFFSGCLRKKTCQLIIFLTFFCSLLFLKPSCVLALTLYVDINYSGSEADGSKQKPFKTISQAMIQAEGEDLELYLGEGAYQESIKTGQDQDIIINGKGKKKTEILGTIATGKDTFLIVKDLSAEEIATGDQSSLVLEFFAADKVITGDQNDVYIQNGDIKKLTVGDKSKTSLVSAVVESIRLGDDNKLMLTLGKDTKLLSAGDNCMLDITDSKIGSLDIGHLCMTAFKNNIIGNILSGNENHFDISASRFDASLAGFDKLLAIDAGNKTLAAIKNSVFFGYGEGALFFGKDAKVDFVNNTLVDINGVALSFDQGLEARIKNSIFANISSYVLELVDKNDLDNLSFTYNDLWQVGKSGFPFYIDGDISLNDFSCALCSDIFSFDPGFVNPINSDYHLKKGSLAIDAGDPDDDYALEPAPNGGRINLGAYGNTLFATRSGGNGQLTPAPCLTHRGLPCGIIRPKPQTEIEDRRKNGGIILPKLPQQINQCDRNTISDVIVREATGIIKTARVVPGSVKAYDGAVEADIEIRNGTKIWQRIQIAGGGDEAEIGPTNPADNVFLTYNLLPPSTSSLFVHVKFTNENQKFLMQFDQGEWAAVIGFLSPVVKYLAAKLPDLEIDKAVPDTGLLLLTKDFLDRLVPVVQKYHLFEDLNEVLNARSSIDRDIKIAKLIFHYGQMLLSYEFQDVLVQMFHEHKIDISLSMLGKMLLGATYNLGEQAVHQWAYLFGTAMDLGASFVEIRPIRGGSGENILPCPPVPLAPKNEILKQKPPTFTWAQPVGVREYNFVIAKDQYFREVITNEQVTGTSYKPLQDLPSDTPLFWRIRSKNARGYSNWSIINVFAIQN